ncbi:hypothetical protein [Candidatus Nitrosotenuis cloacae]|uniref:hypothetical protein n=1 Tax=Candidatus Nitrosotenuis cloacae TaxID=1603555 RepID=UPI0022822A95|nr:hypothetical protein [Candidatus Nitrosotenuis cloacae]
MNKTPEQKWKDSLLEYRKNCQKILDISKSIRYSGVINEYGRTLTGIIRPGLKPILKQEFAKNEFFIISNLITLRNSQAKAFGPFHHAVIQHQKATIVCIPDGKVVYYVSINPDAKSIDDIIRKIKGIV